MLFQLIQTIRNRLAYANEVNFLNKSKSYVVVIVIVIFLG